MISFLRNIFLKTFYLCNILSILGLCKYIFLHILFFFQQPYTAEVSGQQHKPRYLTRSKSHEDRDSQAAIGTARRRIARQGARMVKSRSPSQSPSRHTSPATSPTTSEAYNVDKCDSVESLSSIPGENSALLKEEEKMYSMSSLLICFDENEAPNSYV